MELGIWVGRYFMLLGSLVLVGQALVWDLGRPPQKPNNQHPKFRTDRLGAPESIYRGRWNFDFIAASIGLTYLLNDL